MINQHADLPFQIEVVKGDIIKFKADVLALKYAQSWSFLTQNVVKLLPPDSVLLNKPPRPGQAILAVSDGATPSPLILLVGTPPRKQFTYDSMHDMARQTLYALVDVQPPVKHLALTVHGAGWGFDEAEAFRAMLLGFRAAVEDNKYPHSLQKISIVEVQEKRADVLSQTLAEFQNSTVEKSSRPMPPPPVPGAAPGRSAGVAPPVRSAPTPSPDSQTVATLDEPSIFVAMPFAKKYMDIFYYAIQPAVKDTDHLCVRLDLSSYTGDIIDTIKQRIRAADLMIALLDGTNPNVYLEVGYAWGVGTPTVLIVNEEQLAAGDLPFDVRTQKYLRYEAIMELRPQLTDELRAVLKANARRKKEK